MAPIVHVVPHTHWDREWYHPAARFQLRLAHVVDEALALLSRGRLPSFLLDGQGIVLDDYLAARPESREKLAAHLGAGRLECGPWYVLADNLLVSGESLVRNLLAGGTAVRRYGGTAMKVGYAPDTFGHPAILPTLFAGFGIHNAVTWRGFGGERGQEKDLYRWRGPDGSEVVMIHLPPQGYENGANLPSVAEGTKGAKGTSGENRAVRDRWNVLRTVLEKRARSPYWLVLNGADHHAPQPDIKQAVKALELLAPGVDFVIGPLGEYTARVERWAREHADELPDLVGELRHGRRSQWVLQGTHSARLYLKQANAKCQRLLERVAEPLAALAMLSRSPIPDSRFPEDLQLAWRTLLENHPHDSICGTSSDAVHREMMTRFARCREMAGEIASGALDVVLGHDADEARRAGRAAWQPSLAVFNPTPRIHGGIVVADVALFMSDVRVGQQGSAGDKLEVKRPGALVLRDATGKALPVQELGREDGHDLTESPRYYPDSDAVEWRRVAIAMEELPPLGVAMLRVDQRPGGTTPGSRLPEVGVSEFGLANDNLWLRVESDGSIAAADRASGRSAHGLGGIECLDDQGDSYTSSPRGKNLTAAPDVVAVRVIHAGPLVGELEIVRRWYGADLGIATRVRLDAGARHVEFAFHFENRRHAARRVRAAFPLGHNLAAIVADGPFGPVERAPWPVRRKPRDIESPDPCAPMQRYVTVAGAKDGMTVFADGLPQYEAQRNGTVLVTLMRSFTQLSRPDLAERKGNAGWPTPTPDGAMLGPVDARLAVLLHSPAALDERDEIERVAEAFLNPPVAFMRRSLLHVPAETTGPELEGEGMVFSAMKPAESGTGVILRCYNDSGEVGRGAWDVGKAVSSAAKCRLDETIVDRLEVSRGVVRFEAQPREIVTILLR